MSDLTQAELRLDKYVFIRELTSQESIPAVLRQPTETLHAHHMTRTGSGRSLYEIVSFSFADGRRADPIVIAIFAIHGMQR